MGALGAGATATPPRQPRVRPAEAPVTLSSGRSTIRSSVRGCTKRLNQYMEKNPNVKVDFQWFTFADLAKKV